MTGKLEGRVALITGGTRGIGRAIAESFLAEGASVAINGRSPEKGAATLNDMNAGTRAWYVPGDVMDRDECNKMVDDTAAKAGRLDILVNNAGGLSGFGLIGDLTDEAWDDTLKWCLNSTFWCTRRALPHMVANNWGRIINISSVEGKMANKAAVSPYIVNKHAINGLTKCVAFEYADHGVTCNAICPGAIETDIMRSAGPEAAAAAGITYEQFLQNYANESMIKRLNTVDEVAAMALLLASEVGGGMTGATWNIDGGTSPW